MSATVIQISMTQSQMLPVRTEMLCADARSISASPQV